MSEQQQRQENVLDRYVAIRADDGQRYLVPHFMIPATHQALNAYHRKLDLDVCNAVGGVSFVYFTSVEVSGRSRSPSHSHSRSRFSLRSHIMCIPTDIIICRLAT